jgi:hypothetical protein
MNVEQIKYDMMRKTFLAIMMSVVSIFTFTTSMSCGNHRQQSVSKEPAISENLENQTQALSNLAKAAELIDSDRESYWAYDMADSILRKVDVKNINAAQAKLYSATTYIYYGMSYTRTCSRGSANPLADFKNLSGIINHDYATDGYSMLVNELRAVYAPIFFYKMSNMQSTPQLEKWYATEFDNLKNIKKGYTDSELKAESSRIKQLWFKVYCVMLCDLTSGSQKLEGYSHTFEKLPIKVDDVKAMSNSGYNKIQNDCLKAQTAMINELVVGINNL